MRIWRTLKVCLGLVVRVEVILGMRPRIVLLQVLLRDEEFRALLALVELRALLSRQLEQVLVGRQSFLLQSQLFLQDGVLSLLLLDGIADASRLLIALLVVEVKGASQRLQIVLSVDQVLYRHLTQPEKLDEMSVADPFEIFTVKVGIRQVLQQLLELGQVHLSDDLLHVCVHHVAPIDAALASLKVEFWRHGHQVAEDEVLPRLRHGPDEAIGAACGLGKASHHLLVHQARSPLAVVSILLLCLAPLSNETLVFSID